MFCFWSIEYQNKTICASVLGSSEALLRSPGTNVQKEKDATLHDQQRNETDNWTHQHLSSFRLRSRPLLLDSLSAKGR